MSNEARLMQLGPLPGFTGDATAPAVNTDAVLGPYPANGPGWSHVVYDVSWSIYGNGVIDPLNPPLLTIADGADTIHGPIAVLDMGDGHKEFARPKQGQPNRTMTVTLTAAGPGLYNTLSVTRAMRGNIPLAGADYSVVENGGLLVALD